MANYNIALNSKFKPFSYETLSAPVRESTAAHNALEDQYNNLQVTSDALSTLIDPIKDPEAYKMYKDYSKNLEDKVSNLSKNGLTPSTREDMLALKRSYANSIVPIKTAYASRDALIKEQRQALSKDESLIFDKDMSSLNLNHFIQNPATTYKSVSGNNLQNNVATYASRLAQDIREDPTKYDTILGGQYFSQKIKSGYSDDEILQSLQDNENAIPLLRGLVKKAVESTGVQDWGDPKALDAAYKKASLGLFAAKGKTAYKQLANRGYSATGTTPGKSTGKVPMSIVSSYTQKELEESTSGLNKDAKYLDTIIKDDSLNKAIKSSSMQQTSSTPSNYTTITTSEDKLEKLLNKYNIEGNYDLNDINSRKIAAVQLREHVKNEIKTSLVRANTYSFDAHDGSKSNKGTNKNINSEIMRAAIAMSSNSEAGVTGIVQYKSDYKNPKYRYSDIVNGDSVDSDDLIKYINDKSVYQYIPRKGILVTGTDKDGTHTGLITFDLLDGAGGEFSAFQSQIDAELDEGRGSQAAKGISTMRDMFLTRCNAN